MIDPLFITTIAAGTGGIIALGAGWHWRTAANTFEMRALVAEASEKALTTQKRRLASDLDDAHTEVASQARRIANQANRLAEIGGELDRLRAANAKRNAVSRANLAPHNAKTKAEKAERLAKEAAEQEAARTKTRADLKTCVIPPRAQVVAGVMAARKSKQSGARGVGASPG